MWFERVYPRASAVAERLWSPASLNNPSNAAGRLSAFRCHMVSSISLWHIISGAGVIDIAVMGLRNMAHAIRRCGMEWKPGPLLPTGASWVLCTPGEETTRERCICMRLKLVLTVCLLNSLMQARSLSLTAREDICKLFFVTRTRQITTPLLPHLHFASSADPEQLQ